MLTKNSQFLFATVATVMLTVGITEQSAQSAVLALSDDNSVAAFEPSSPDDPANSGLLFWTVDDVNHLFQNQFWYRIGSTGKENPISNLNLIGIDQTQAASNQLTATYAGTGFEVSLDLKLNGGQAGSKSSSLVENIKITNTDVAQLDFHLFKYTDFDLNDNGQQDTTNISANIATQFDKFTLATKVVAPSASYYQVSTFPEILNALTDDFPTTLSNFPGTLTGENAYALQWNVTLAPATSFSVTSYTSIAPVPEPTMTLGCLIGFGVLGLGRRSRHTS